MATVQKLVHHLVDNCSLVPKTILICGRAVSIFGRSVSICSRLVSICGRSEK